MKPGSGPARGAAAAIALIASAGLAIQLRATFGLTGSLTEALWTVLRFFTIWTNIAIAVVMTGVALGRPQFGSPRLLGLVTLSILLVGIVYWLLLRGLLELSGDGAKLADTMLHQVVPVLVPLFWLLLAPKGGLTGRYPLLWAIFPLVYVVYVLARGAADGKYPYPFINVARIGWSQTAIDCAAIGVGFFLVGYAFVWLDRRLGR